MKVIYLVTGATGYLGHNIIHRLVTEGKRVRALVLPGDQGVRRLPANVRICEGNVLHSEDLERFFTVPEDTPIIVIHAVSIVSTSWHYDRRIFAVNVQGTRNVVEQCIRARVKKLVYISSVHALPELPAGQPITECSQFNPRLITGFYGKTKAMASQIVMDAARSGKLRATLVFPSGLCGPFDYATGYVTQLLLDCAKNRLPAGIEGGYDFIDVRDVAEGVVLACEKGADGEGYILANRYVSATKMIRSVQEYTGARPVKYILPVWAAQAFLPFFHIYYKLRRKRPLFTRYSLYTLTSNSRFSSEKARRELGFTTRPFTETIVDTLNWLREEGKI